MEIGGGRSGEREGSHAWICPAPIDLNENLNPGNMKDYVQRIEQCGEPVSIFFVSAQMSAWELLNAVSTRRSTKMI